MIYQFKPGAHIRGGLDAQTVGDRLDKIKLSTNLTAEAVVADARPPKAVLHPAFEWDDAIAAEEFRKEQARHLIAAVVYSPYSGEPDRWVRAYVVVNDIGAEDRYESITVAMADPQLRVQVLARALREFRAWQAKYKDLQELADVFAAAEGVARRHG